MRNGCVARTARTVTLPSVSRVMTSGASGSGGAVATSGRRPGVARGAAAGKAPSPGAAPAAGAATLDRLGGVLRQGLTEGQKPGGGRTHTSVRRRDIGAPSGGKYADAPPLAAIGRREVSVSFCRPAPVWAT